MYIPSLPPVSPDEATAFSLQKVGEGDHSLALYQAQDYLPAYAAHTDLRVQQDGPQAAIGGNWAAGGAQQLAFLKAQGLTPQHRVLDFGCGTGRLARVLVPYLEPRHYTGMDISLQALLALSDLAGEEGWISQGFRLLCGDGTLTQLAGEQYDVIWAFAVWIHNPVEVIEACLASLRDVTFHRLYFTYKSAAVPCRSSYKQFAAPLSWYQETAQRYGFQVHAVEGMPHIPQALAQLTKATNE